MVGSGREGAGGKTDSLRRRARRSWEWVARVLRVVGGVRGEVVRRGCSEGVAVRRWNSSRREGGYIGGLGVRW